MYGNETATETDDQVNVGPIQALVVRDKLHSNLLSCNQLVDQGYNIHFHDKGGNITCSWDEAIDIPFTRVDGAWKMDFDEINSIPIHKHLSNAAYYTHQDKSTTVMDYNDYQEYQQALSINSAISKFKPSLSLHSYAVK